MFRSAVLGLLLAAAAAADKAFRLSSSPFLPCGEDPSGRGLCLVLDPSVYAELASLPVGARVDLPSLPLPFLSQGAATSNVALALTRFSAAEKGEDLPLAVLLRGRVYLGGEEELRATSEPAEMVLGSTVYLGLSRFGSHGFLEVGERRFFLSTPEPSLEGQDALADRYVKDLLERATSSPLLEGPAARGWRSFGTARPSVLSEVMMVGEGAKPFALDLSYLMPPEEVVRETDAKMRAFAAEQPAATPFQNQSASGQPHPAQGARMVERRTYRLAAEADHQFYQLKGWNIDAMASYYYILVGNAASLFGRDFGSDFVSVYFAVWTSQDPYPYSSGGALEHMQRNWDPRNPSRSMAALISAKNLGGGMAYMRTLCNTQWAYAVSGNMVGYFPTPLTHYHSQNWDIFVFAHEIGHVWGASHTHDLNPPPDRCGSTPGCGSTAGSIMSYCHGCSGGMSNIYLAFHDYTKNEVWPFIGSVAC